MISKKSSTKGLQNIRTMAGRDNRVTADHDSHKAYLRIAVLEIEKNRRLKERELIMGKVHAIDNRLHDLEAEKKELLQHVLGESMDSSVAKRSAESKAISGKDEAFRFKYG